MLRSVGTTTRWGRALLFAVLCWNLIRSDLQAQVVVEAGDLIVANYSAAAGAVSRVNPNTGAASLLGSFVLPTATALAPNGCLYVTEWSGSIRCIRLSDGLVTTLSCSVPLSQLWGIAVSDTGDLFLTSASGNRVIRLNPATGIGSVITSGGNLQSPTGIAFLDTSNLVVSSQLNSQIVKISLPAGTQTLLSAPPNTINQPWGIAVNAGSLYVGAHDSRQIQRITGSALSVVGVVDLAPLGIAVAANGDVYAGIADILQSIYKIQRIAADGTLLGYYSGPLIGQATGLTLCQQTIQAQSQTNTPPEIAPVADIVVGEGEIVSFTATATDTNWPLQSVRFSLDPGSPAGVTITPDGSVSWIPTESQGPGLYTLTLRATDDGVPQASSTRTVLVNVIEVNTAPVLSAITNRVISAGSTLSFQAQASDADLPPNLLTFSLLAGAPTNALISSDGLFSWTPSSSQAPSTNLIKVKVSDNGVPSLSATQSFTVTVRAKTPLTVTALSTNRSYGATNPTFSGLLTGVLPGDGITAVYSSSATAASPVGSYAIVPTLIDPLGRLGGYSVQATNGTLTIKPASTLCLLSSSANPALPGTEVTFTGTVSMNPPGTIVPEGQMQFKINGNNSGTAVPLVAGQAVYRTLLPAGSYAVSADYLGTSNLSASATSLGAPQIANTPPVAAPDLLQRFRDRGAKVSIHTLLLNDTDADLDTLSLSTIAAWSTGGGVITRDGEWIHYDPAASLLDIDQFEYTILDTHGASARGTVTVQTAPISACQSNVEIRKQANGDTLIHVDGIPQHPFRVEFNDDLISPNWMTLISGATDAAGMFEILDPAPPSTRTYRSVYP